jgi:L-malate glycosyltransferase
LRQQLQQYGYDITVIPNTLELDHYTFRHRNQVQPHLFWMRSFHPLYNPEMAVRVLAEVRRILPEATLVMGGGDKGALEPTRQLAQELGVAEAVTFAGYLSLEAKQQHFAAADIYLNTNRADNMPVTVLEAGANGLVVIATEVGGIPYLVENEKSALLVPNDDASAMAEAVVRVVQQSSLAATLSSGGRQLAESCSWTRVLPQWQRLFETF